MRVKSTKKTASSRMLRSIRSRLVGAAHASSSQLSSLRAVLRTCSVSIVGQQVNKRIPGSLQATRAYSVDRAPILGAGGSLTTLLGNFNGSWISPRAGGGFVEGRRSVVSKKEVFWNGTKRSLDPTAPSVVPRRPTTPSERHTAIIDKSLLWRGSPVPKLSIGKRKTGGRNNQGVITVRHRGGGTKRRYRLVDFKRVPMNNPNIVSGTVERIEYDPNRSAFIALLKHKLSPEDASASPKLDNPEKPTSAVLSYIICPRGINVGSELQASRSKPLDIRPGNSMPLRFIPVGTTVHNIELAPGRGGQICRSAGTSAQVLETDEARGLSLLRLQSKEQRYVRINCMATVGEVSNPEFKNQKLGKAGRSRWMGRRPSVRGVAMNPIDHPHGGGEGKTHHGGPPRSPWGMLTKGYKTVRKIRPWIRIPRWKARRDK